MTPPGGSRDDDDGAPGDDPTLRAMRAVWLEMREEDPPDRGMTDLLAAARSKAAAMQPPPSAWQRLLAALRRPPVLALATVTVLVAGAVLIGRRVTDERERGATTRPPLASEAGSAGAPGPLPADPPAPPPSGVLAQPSSTVTAPVPAHPPRTPGAPSVRTDPRSAPAPASHAPAPRGREQDGEDRDATRPAPSMPAASTSGQPSSESAPPFGAEAAVHGFGTAKASDAGKPPARPAPPADPAPGDMYQQCEAAARQGDCAAVRRLVSRITRIDRGYRARVAKDSSVGKCLAE